MLSTDAAFDIRRAVPDRAHWGIGSQETAADIATASVENSPAVQVDKSIAAGSNPLAGSLRYDCQARIDIEPVAAGQTDSFVDRAVRTDRSAERIVADQLVLATGPAC